MPSKKLLASAALAASIAGGGIAGALIGAPMLSGAQETTTSTAPAQAPSSSTAPATPPAQAPDGQSGRPSGPPPQGSFDPSKGGHMKDGKTETLLTGDAATKTKAAAEAAVPGGTVLRVENDVDEDAPYEAHVRKADGSEVTVKLDASFNQISIQDGPR